MELYPLLVPSIYTSQSSNRSVNMSALDFSLPISHDRFWRTSGPFSSKHSLPRADPRKSKPAMNRRQDSSLLSRLPREIRDNVYGHLFHDRDRVVSIGGFNAQQLEKAVQPLRSVDRSGQLHREALQLYFRTRTFVFCRRLDFCFAWRTIRNRMKLYAIDIHDELRQVEIYGWSLIAGKRAKLAKRRWELVRDAMKMAVRVLQHCTALSSINVCLESGRLFLEELRPLLDIECKRTSLEICAGTKVGKWVLSKDVEVFANLFGKKDGAEAPNAEANQEYVQSLFIELDTVHDVTHQRSIE